MSGHALCFCERSRTEINLGQKHIIGLAAAGPAGLVPVPMQIVYFCHTYTCQYNSKVHDNHHMFILTAPSAPLNVTAFNTSSSSVRVTWDRPGTPRGIIRDYVISYYPTDVGASSSMSTSTGNNSEVTDLTELDIYTSYTITVTAVTIAQGDPSTSVSVFTDEDGKCMVQISIAL